MKKILLLSTFFLVVVYGNSQEVIPSSGNYHESIFGSSLTYTIGEPFINTFMSDDLILTQGFNQSLLTVTSIGEDPGSQLNVSVFPNPTHDFIIVQHQKNTDDEWDYSIINKQGKQIAVGKISNRESVIDVQNLKPAIYMLRIYTQDKPVKTFKIVKN